MTERVRIFDTTLRDGEQSPGFSMNIDEKIRMAHQLARLGVDVIEAGFPIASPGDFEAVRRIATEVKGPIIAGLSRITEKDIDRSADAIAPAEKKRIHTFSSGFRHSPRAYDADLPRGEHPPQRQGRDPRPSPRKRR